ncbi:hypothetical protein F4779DRAFT_585500 [Xylariaceae sp. FL0662B]|nr:hypothetical protein F4779DRAFT_585500 [Xylariaceae sp. FL0662B]
MVISTVLYASLMPPTHGLSSITSDSITAQTAVDQAVYCAALVFISSQPDNESECPIMQAVLIMILSSAGATIKPATNIRFVVNVVQFNICRY